MAEKGPGDRAEEGVILNIGRARTGAQSFDLIFDEEFSNKRFAETTPQNQSTVGFSNIGHVYLLADLCGMGVIRKWNLVPQDVCKCGVSVLALERGGSKEHFVD